MMLGPLRSAFSLFLAMGIGLAACGGTQGGGAATPAQDQSATRLPGLDTSQLTGRELRELDQYLHQLPSPCADVAVPIAQCLAEKRACTRCLPAAKYVLQQVRDGRSPEQVETSYKNRFDPASARSVPIDGSPTRGPADSPVVFVEFADFECPFCAQVAPVLDKEWEKRKDKVLFVFKFLPLSMHPHAEPAARAAIAAWEQGKFWEMHRKLFENRDRLEQSDLERYATELGLDLSRFRADMQSAKTTDRLSRDRKLADALGVKGTPTMYVNGREYDPRQELGDWLDTEISLVRGDK